MTGWIFVRGVEQDLKQIGVAATTANICGHSVSAYSRTPNLPRRFAQGRKCV
jgi:hypothetical protein